MVPGEGGKGNERACVRKHMDIFGYAWVRERNTGDTWGSLEAMKHYGAQLGAPSKDKKRQCYVDI